MLTLQKLIVAMYPGALIEGTAWAAEWNLQERNAFVRVANVFFPLVAAAYVAHYFFYDKALGLEPIEYWLAFRLTAAAVCMAAVISLRTKLVETRFYKVPSILALAALCYSQAIVTAVHDVSYFFCFVFVLASVMVLRETPFASAIFSAIVLAIQAPWLTQADVAPQMVVSGGVVTTVIGIAIRTSYASEVRNFILTKENFESQQRVAELSQDFSKRLSSFIPGVIARRLEEAVSGTGKSVLDAAVEVLRPKRMTVSCLFSDIRGFTQGSKSLESFVSESVIPEVRACSDAIEANNGIPRKIGDLVFAYFDAERLAVNVANSLLAGLEIAKINEAMNATVSKEKINRYILIASGEAIVGNVGGVDSSVEITALGSPVNFLSRLDDATKLPAFESILTPGDLIACERTMSEISTCSTTPDIREVDLNLLGVSIRDFPEVKRVFVLKPSESNLLMIRKIALEQNRLGGQAIGVHSPQHQQIA